MTFRHIVLSTDLSTEASRGFARVEALAKDVGARLTLLHVVEDHVVPPTVAPYAAPAPVTDPHERMEEARRLLEFQRDEAGLEAELAVTVDSSAARGIVDYAQEAGADLIALSTHGRTGFRRLMLGSVAESVLRHSPLPVLSFPRQQAETEE
ncbi:MAG: universal stress protein [Planctomycetota bacterium]